MSSLQASAMGELGDQLGIRWFHFGLILVCWVVQLPMVAIVATAPFKLKEIKQEFGLDNVWASLVVTSVLLGSIAGVILCGTASDWIGRRKSIMVFNVALGLGNLFHFCIPHNGGFYSLVLLRVLLGIPYGGMLTTVVPYLIEFFPNDVRGAAGVSLSLAWPIGTIFSLIFMKQFQDEMGWRICFATTPMVATLLAILCLSTCPESPRWCIVSGHFKEAQQTLDFIFAQPVIYGHGYKGKAPELLTQDLSPTRSASSLCSSSTSTSTASSTNFFTRFSYLFTPELRRSTIVASLLYVSLAGVANSLWTWGPEVLEWVTGGKVGLGPFEVGQAACASGILILMIFIDRAGRRKVLVSLYVFCAITFALLAAHPSMNWTVIIWMSYQIADGALWSVVGTYMNEIFPTEIRGTAVGFCTFWGRIASVLAPMGVGFLIDRICIVILLIFIVTFLFAACLAAFLAEETAGRPMPDECNRIDEDSSSEY